MFPNDGVLKQATFITKIVGRTGKVLYQNNDAGHKVLEPNVAREGIDMMEGPVRHGTAAGSLASMARPIAGKTGTTDDNRDAWFVGFTPQITAAVWMGNLGSNTPMTNSATRGAGTYPAQIWRAFMESATANLPPLDFAKVDPTTLPRAALHHGEGSRLLVLVGRISPVQSGAGDDPGAAPRDADDAAAPDEPDRSPSAGDHAGDRRRR